MIGVCGAGSTGSSAVTDLLKEYRNIKVLDKREFPITYFPDGIEDLEFHLMHQKAKFFSSDIAIRRFLKYTKSICHNSKSYYYKLTDGHFSELVDEYVKSITQMEYMGRWMFDDYIFDSIFHKIVYALKKKIKPLENKTLRKMYFSIEPDGFYEKTEKFLKSVYNYYDSKELFVIDQPFPGNNPINSMKLYGKDSKAIIVLRDPRDLYITAKEYYFDFSNEWMPNDDVYKFIKFYKTQYESVFNRNDIIYVNFEDLIFNYDKTVEKIIDFCGVSEDDHIYKLRDFDPNKSLKNTQLFIKNTKYNDDIKIIEKEMKDYLYSFSKYNKIDYSTDVF